MGKALYRKYRPSSLSEIIGQEHITLTLSNALKNGQISHAYLFTGPRGVGKTSVARVLAHEVNGFNYSDEQNYLDIIEIDAASNRRIDEIRQLRDKVNIAPSSGKYKVYIIDEVHMLTREAFNALLKTLEEPPEHVIFILATTEAHKVPETIISRTQQFNFRPISNSKIYAHLKSIAKEEKIKADDQALEIIAEYGQGSFRDSISLLDQAHSLSPKITEADLESLLGMAPTKIINGIVASIEHGSTKELMAILLLVDEGGYNLTVVCKQLITELKNLLLSGKSGLGSEEMLEIMKRVNDAPTSNDSLTTLEIVLLEAVFKRNPVDSIIPITSLTSPANDGSPTETGSPSREPNKPAPAEIAEVFIEEPAKAKPHKSQKLDDEIWPDVLNAIKTKYNTLYGVIRMALPDFQAGSLILKTKFDFHKRLLTDAKNQSIIINIIRDLTGQTVTIQCVVDKNFDTESREERSQDLVDISQSITTINNIFGSSEVIE